MMDACEKKNAETCYVFECASGDWKKLQLQMLLRQAFLTRIRFRDSRCVLYIYLPYSIPPPHSFVFLYNDSFPIHSRSPIHEERRVHRKSFVVSCICTFVYVMRMCIIVTTWGTRRGRSGNKLTVRFLLGKKPASVIMYLKASPSFPLRFSPFSFYLSPLHWHPSSTDWTLSVITDVARRQNDHDSEIHCQPPTRQSYMHALA